MFEVSGVVKVSFNKLKGISVGKLAGKPISKRQSVLGGWMFWEETVWWDYIKTRMTRSSLDELNA